ncbi:transporter substrate-binding domain-containing protein [Maridesulfovibrio sp.]|uniref:substrate-binding periplasmic protein n=1 Tax=Maridesulfovibrio sp. TaxID=2795000 RepID=UPI002AA7FF92|nr:transporter substrate-binding domain-containing protein [Maridesulfovibrio sp.]
MKRFAIFLGIAFFVFSPFLTGKIRAETFRVMRYCESFPPYYFNSDSPQSGIVRDLFTALTKETGDNFEFVDVPYKRGLYKFDSGQVDIEPMANPVWRKHAKVPGVYSIPFAVSEQIILYNSKYYQMVNMPDDLLGETIGTVYGYTYPVYGPYFEKGMLTAYAVKNENKLVQMLLAGRLHQAIMNKDFAIYAVKERDAEGQLIASEPCNSVKMMIRFHPSKKKAVPRFDRALKKLIADGTINKIYEKYR